MSVWIHTLERRGNKSFLVNDVGNTSDQFEHQQVCDAHIIESAQFEIGVNKQIKRQVFPFDESAMTGLGIGADTQYDRIFLFELRVKVAEPARL